MRFYVDTTNSAQTTDSSAINDALLRRIWLVYFNGNLSTSKQIPSGTIMIKNITFQLILCHTKYVN